MSSPSRSTRRPAVAGSFYPADADQCRREAAKYVRPSGLAGGSAGGLAGGAVNGSVGGLAGTGSSPQQWIGAVVPHAGWICSGAIAGEAIGTLAASLGPAGGAAGAGNVDVVVVFGAVHTPLPLHAAALASQEAWEVPGNTSSVSLELMGRMTTDAPEFFGVDDRFHLHEHAVEVELPLIQRAWPNALLLPIEIPLMDDAVQIGIRTAAMVQSANLRPVYLASSDLTHYGPAYQFAPAGVGIAGLRWAKENDRRLLSVITNMTPERVVPEVRRQFNACGGGAIAATMAACREHGATQAMVLRHQNSFEVLANIAPQKPDNAVGYAGIVIG